MELELGDKVVNQYGIEAIVTKYNQQEDKIPFSVSHISGMRYDIVFKDGTSPESDMTWIKINPT